MAIYVALDNINNGQHRPGDRLELDEAEAAPLLALRVIREATAEEIAALAKEEPSNTQEPAAQDGVADGATEGAMDAPVKPKKKP